MWIFRILRLVLTAEDEHFFDNLLTNIVNLFYYNVHTIPLKLKKCATEATHRKSANSDCCETNLIERRC